MRYAVLSDIHSNLEALTAALDFLSAQKIGRYFCAGDVLGYGADPLPCLQKLQALDALVVAGNHDQACIGKLDESWFNLPAREAIRWTRGQLGIMDMDLLRRLPLHTSEGPFTLVHSALRHPERFTYLVDPGGIVDSLILCRTLFCLAGHTHYPCVVEYDFEQRRLLNVFAAPDELKKVPFVNNAHARRYFVNPGSVGQPRDGDARASFAIIDMEASAIEFHRVAYNIPAAQEKIRKAALPGFLADRLAMGR